MQVFLKRMRQLRKAEAITYKEYRTICGQAIAGDLAGARKGLVTILNRKRRKEKGKK